MASLVQKTSLTPDKAWRVNQLKELLSKIAELKDRVKTLQEKSQALTPQINY